MWNELKQAFLIGAARGHYKTRRAQLKAIKAQGLTVSDLRALPAPNRKTETALNFCLPFAGFGIGWFATYLYHLLR